MKILVVDDELGLRHTLSIILSDDGHEVSVAGDGTAALALARAQTFDLVLCDVRMPGIDGFTFLDRYHEQGGRGIAIMMSAYGDDAAAVEAIRRGAYDFIAKPFHADQVLLVIRKAIERERLKAQIEELEGEIAALRAPHDIVGRSAVIEQVVTIARKVAKHPSTVLVTGESGTGKELVARLIHDGSPRESRPFVAVNCAAIPEGLLESELFGHARGSFTGAAGERTGLFEEADGGTLFLDEIGELPVPLQAKLLRALQEGEIRRVGDNAARPVDVRLVAATARDLETDVAEGRFRADLYYRVNVVRLHLPPLRDRSEDIPELVQHFVSRFNARLHLSVRSIAPAAMRRLMEYPWPGNIRELENVVERMMVLAGGPQIEVDHLPPTIAEPASALPLANGATDLDLSVKRQTEALERVLIERALRRTNGNRTRAAKLLDLSHRALLYKIREYGLDK